MLDNQTYLRRLADGSRPHCRPMLLLYHLHLLLVHATTMDR
jgi:hypothetical protein